MKKCDLQTYLENRQSLLKQKPIYRTLCGRCHLPTFSCYCSSLQSFNPKIQFVILIHPIEFQRRIATGRMSHLILEGSHFIKGQDYSNNMYVNQLIEDSNNHSLILYPGISSVNLTDRSECQRASLFPSNKKITIFVIDGTWATARKMVRQSQNLQNLPRICFARAQPSNFRVRKQPAAHCVSTIEAIHETIELIGEVCGFDTKDRIHDRLLKAFNQMVEKQIEYVKKYA